MGRTAQTCLSGTQCKTAARPVKADSRHAHIGRKQLEHKCPVGEIQYIPQVCRGAAIQFQLSLSFETADNQCEE